MADEAVRTRPVRLGELHPERRDGPGGTIYVRARETLGDYHRTILDPLEHWAKAAPDRIVLADRDEDGSWRTVSYAAFWQQIESLAQALLDMGLGPDRPLAVLSGNEIEHALMGYSAMLVGVPYCPVSPAYSLLSGDFGKLRQIAGTLRPGLVYATDGAAYGRAIDAVFAGLPVVVRRNPGPGARLVSDLLRTVPRDVAAQRATLGPDTVAKLLYTSGSTGSPKGVITTQRMLCCNQQMIRQCLAFLEDEPPVLVDWMPWHHVAGGSHNVGLTIVNGGSFYIDDGLATPQGIGRTVRTLSEIAPTVYFNVPKGYELLCEAMAGNAKLRDTFFSRVRLTQYAGAGISQHVMDELDRAAVSTVGERILMITGFGSTETAPFAFTTTGPVERAGTVGLPAPGLEIKLVPNAEKMELRVRGPNVTPGYRQEPDRTAESFDEEGYYRMGDALRFVDPERLERGFLFDGRVSEDFKLATGTWVNVGALRAAVIAACAPLATDAVMTGLDRNAVGALIFPNPEACRAIGDEAAVRAASAQRLAGLARGATGSSNHVARAMVLAEPPNADAGEITPKGSLNMRAVLARRAALVDALYADPSPAEVIVVPRGTPAGASSMAQRDATMAAGAGKPTAR